MVLTLRMLIALAMLSIAYAAPTTCKDSTGLEVPCPAASTTPNPAEEFPPSHPTCQVTQWEGPRKDVGICHMPGPDGLAGSCEVKGKYTLPCDHEWVTINGQKSIEGCENPATGSTACKKEGNECSVYQIMGSPSNQGVQGNFLSWCS